MMDIHMLTHFNIQLLEKAPILHLFSFQNEVLK